jgi:hypothetical protein
MMKHKTKHTTMSEQLQNQNKEIHDRPFCRLDTGTSSTIQPISTQQATIFT